MALMSHHQVVPRESEPLQRLRLAAYNLGFGMGVFTTCV